MLLVIAGLPVYAFPPVDTPRQADVAYVIGPPTRERVALAEQLKTDGLVGGVLISVPATGEQSASELSACSHAGVVCATPDPMTTKGEVALLAAYARSHPADRVTVITFTPHVARTRFIFDRCSPAQVQTVAAATQLDPLEWAYQYAYQTAAFAKAAVTSCDDPE